MKRCSKRQPSVCRWALRGAFVCAGFFAATVWILTNNASAQTPRAPWIWAREHQPGAVPPGECHFRKEFRTEAPQRAVLSIQADDDYIVYVNGKMVQSGSHGERPEQIDISRYIKRGGNLVVILENEPPNNQCTGYNGMGRVYRCSAEALAQLPPSGSKLAAKE